MIKVKVQAQKKSTKQIMPKSIDTKELKRALNLLLRCSFSIEICRLMAYPFICIFFIESFSFDYISFDRKMKTSIIIKFN